MPKRRKTAPARPAPIQLPLFAEAASLIRVRAERNEYRFYRLEVWPDLFGHTLLLRQWGRLGTEGRRRLDPHPDPGAALNALARIAQASGAVAIRTVPRERAIKSQSGGRIRAPCP
jgi:predicted DNA-binding WGR domain protein